MFMIIGGTMLFTWFNDFYTTIRGGKVVSKVKDVSEGMVAVQELARSSQRTEKTIEKLGKTSKTRTLCEKCLTLLNEELEDL